MERRNKNYIIFHLTESHCIWLFTLLQKFGYNSKKQHIYYFSTLLLNIMIFSYRAASHFSNGACTPRCTPCVLYATVAGLVSILNPSQCPAPHAHPQPAHDSPQHTDIHTSHCCAWTCTYKPFWSPSTFRLIGICASANITSQICVSPFPGR